MSKSKAIKTNDSGSKNNERERPKPAPSNDKENPKGDKNVAGNKDNKPEEQVTDKASEFILPAGTVIGTNIQSADKEKD